MFPKNFFLLFILPFISFCSNNTSTNKSQGVKSTNRNNKPESVIIVTPQSGDMYNLGDSININIKIKQKIYKADSAHIFINNNFIYGINDIYKQIEVTYF